MRRFYAHPTGHSRAVLAPFIVNGVVTRWVVQTLSTDDGFLRQGLASQVMEQITVDADNEGTELCLLAVGSSEHIRYPSSHDLEEFYRRYGFVNEKGASGYMCRRPQV